MENQQNNQLTTQSGALSLRADLKKYPALRALKNDIPLEQALAYVFILIGLPKPYPDGLEKQVLITHLKESYPGHIAPEIISAFKMSINRQLGEIDYDALLNHYGTFSPKYISGIMNAYNENHRGRILIEKVKPIYETPEFNQQFHYESWLMSAYELVKQDKPYNIPEFIAVGFYDDLSKWGLLEFSKEDRAEFGNQAHEMCPEKKRKSIYEVPEADDERNHRIIKKAKALALKRWLELKAFDDTDIRSLIWPKIL